MILRSFMATLHVYCFCTYRCRWSSLPTGLGDNDIWILLGFFSMSSCFDKSLHLLGLVWHVLGVGSPGSIHSGFLAAASPASVEMSSFTPTGYHVVALWGDAFFSCNLGISSWPMSGLIESFFPGTGILTSGTERLNIMVFHFIFAIEEGQGVPAFLSPDLFLRFPWSPQVSNTLQENSPFLKLTEL